MERNEERFYTTGEFAEYFGIKKDTLLYYDKIKLFCPAKIENNGYRYYTSAQIGTFWTILSLREVGVPIKVLQEYFRQPAPECLNDIMEKQIKEINAEMEKLRKIKRLLSGISSAVKEAENAALGQVKIVTLPEQRIVCSKQNSMAGDTSNEQWENIYDDFVRERGLAGTAYVGSVIAWEDLRKDRFGYVDRLFTVGTGKGGVIREGGTYALLYHKGDYDSIPQIYPYLISEIGRLGYSIAGDAYEEYLISEIATDCADDFITKIIVKVASN